MASWLLPVLLAASAGGAVYAWRRLVVPRAKSTGADAVSADHAAIVGYLSEVLDTLALKIGPRHALYRYEALDRAMLYLRGELQAAGYEVEQQLFVVDHNEVSNLIVEIPGTTRADEIVVVGAHYDTIPDSPGANDNGTGVATVLALARAFRDATPERTIRLCLFVNEEPPFFQTERMGSHVYAKRCRERGDDIVAMLCPETIGYYSDEPGSQEFPGPLEAGLGDVGDFIAFVTHTKDAGLLHSVVDHFRAHAAIRAEGAALPGAIHHIGWSDHWSFWQFDYPGIMLTDTAPFRYPYYHSPEDTPDKVDLDRTAQVVAGIRGVVEELSGASASKISDFEISKSEI